MTDRRRSYVLQVQLQDIRPAIWRRIHVADTTTLMQLHTIVQAAMGWEDRHAWAFDIAGQCFGLPDADWADDPTLAARRYTVDQLLQGKPLRMRYYYDFNDRWEHRIKLHECVLVDSATAAQLPQCVAGRHACPPEDCGGVAGYQLLRLNHPDASFTLESAQARVQAAPLHPQRINPALRRPQQLAASGKDTALA